VARGESKVKMVLVTDDGKVKDVVEADMAQVLRGGDVITMAEGWPRIGTPEFEAKLAEWHEAQGKSLSVKGV
jgi:hypothetical protein